MFVAQNSNSYLISSTLRVATLYTVYYTLIYIHTFKASFPKETFYKAIQTQAVHMFILADCHGNLHEY
jgi:hypothetical protein